MAEVNKSTDVLGQSRIFTREVINDIHVKAELGRYRMRGFSIFKKIPTGTSSCSCPEPSPGS